MAETPPSPTLKNKVVKEQMCHQKGFDKRIVKFHLNILVTFVGGLN